jgi:lipopolysaccharide heptosyltransferase II
VRPATRQPYPLASQLRHYGAALVYWIVGLVASRWFRRPVALADLKTAKILVLKPCCLGDVVFATPLLRELREALPEARLVVAVGAHSRPALEGSPRVDALFDPGSVGSGRYRLRELLDVIWRVRSERFDACFGLERSAVLNLIPLLAGVPRRIGIDSGGRGFSLTVAVSPRPARPESELYLDLFRAIGGRPHSHALEYAPPAAARDRVEQVIRSRIPAGRPFVVLHCSGGMNPGMALPRKRWPSDSFGELASRLLQTGVSVVLVGARDDRPVADAVLARIEAVRAEPSGESTRTGHDGVVDLVGQLSLAEVAALACRASAYVGNDSGPTHLAEAAGARVIALFGPSEPIVYGPRNRNAVALRANIWCSPCFEDGRFPPCANVLCMRSIAVERVWREVVRNVIGQESPP